MHRELLEAYIKALLESDEELQREFASAGGGAIQGFVGSPLIVKTTRKRKNKKKKQQ